MRSSCPVPHHHPLTRLLAEGLGLDWLLTAARPAVDVPELPPAGMQGLAPLPWWAAGSYEGELRRGLLALRSRPERRSMDGLIGGLAAALHDGPGSQGAPPLLVPVPSWKRRGNPLPQLLGEALARLLGWPMAPLLQRSRPVLGQHHLGRELRWANQAGAFSCEQLILGRRGPRPAVLVVDDILTTGATALAAATAVTTAGWRLHGLACLARTPWKGRDLRSKGRRSDGPG